MPSKTDTAIAAKLTTETLGTATLLDQIMAETMLAPTQEGYQVAKQGLRPSLQKSSKAMSQIN